MPGDPTGIPATANPMADGRSDRRRLIAEAGTWPSMTYPSIWAVWQEPRAAGIESCDLRGARSLTSFTRVAKPAACTCSTQPEQQPQLGSLLMTIVGVAALTNSNVDPPAISRPAKK